MQRNWPLVGRREELDLVLEIVEHQHRSVVLAGRAGVGKTRLARAALDKLAARGLAAELVIGTRAAASIPFGAVSSFVPRARGPERPGTTITAVHDALLERAGERPLVLGVDDGHCLDDVSATVVHQLAVSGGARLLVTVRSGESAPDSVTALWKDGIAERIELQPLSTVEMRQVLEAALDGPVAEATAVELVRSCAGNCLYLRELVHAALDEGSLVVDQGLWRLRGRRTTSPRLVDLVEPRARELHPATRAVVELVAIGEPLPLALLESVATHEALEDAARRDFVDVERDGWRSVIRLVHPIYGEVVRARLAELTWRAHCRTLADALQVTGLRRHEDVLRLATWRLAAGQRCDIDVLLAATDLALEGGDLVAGERFAAAAVSGVTASADQRISAHLALADTRSRRGDHDGAIAALDAARPETDDQAVAVAETRANSLFLRGRWNEAEAYLRDVLARLEDPVVGARLALTRARSMVGRGRPLDALDVLDRSRVDTPELEYEATLARAIMLALAGRFDEAERAALRTLDPAFASATVISVNWPGTAKAPATTEPPVGVQLIGMVGRGRLAEAERLSRDILDLGLALDHGTMRQVGAGVTGWVLFLRGAVGPAINLLIEALADTSSFDANGVRTLAFAALAGSYALASDLDLAEQTVARAERDEHPIRWFDQTLAIPRAFIAIRRGLPSEARRVIAAALDESADAGLRIVELEVAAAAARVGVTDLAARSLERLAGCVDGPLPGLLLDHVVALEAGDPVQLSTAADGLERCGMDLTAAETLALAATQLAERGDARGALIARTRSSRSADRCPGADRAFLNASQTLPSLTPREREIARLAAAGNTSGQIAERLFISVRTVDNHLGRIYLKLGVACRADLVDARI
jgi:DNA-binding CsgD family transcriptional regulator